MEGSKAGAVVRAFVIHHCSPGLIPGPGVICRFVVGSRPSTDDFSLGEREKPEKWSAMAQIGR